MVAVLALEAAVEVSWSHGLTALERICAVWSKYPPVGEMGEDAAEGECPVSMSRREAAVFWVGATLRVRVGGWSGVGWVRGFLYVFWLVVWKWSGAVMEGLFTGHPSPVAYLCILVAVKGF